MSTRCSEPQRFVRDAISNPETTLLVRGSSHDGAIIRLEGKVLTIGNSPNVKLRLLAKGVKPLHAVLIRGPVAVGGDPPVVHQAVALENAEHNIGIADVENQNHSSFSHPFWRNGRPRPRCVTSKRTSTR